MPPVGDPASAASAAGLATFDVVVVAAGRPVERWIDLERALGNNQGTLVPLTYLRPTLVRCDSPEHPLANREFLFPFAAVVRVTPEAFQSMPEAMGKTLVVTALTSDRPLLDRLLASPLVDRLNVGPIATNHISWDQPHEGNLFEHLYARRSFQAVEPGKAGAVA